MSKTGNLHIICHDFSANSDIQLKHSDSICRQLKSGIITQAKNDKVNLIYSSVDKTDNYLEESTNFSNIVASAVWEPFSVKKIQTFLSEVRELSPCFKVSNFEGIFQIITDLIVNAQIKANNRSITIYSDKWETLKITKNIERALEVLDQTQCDVNLVYRMLKIPIPHSDNAIAEELYKKLDKKSHVNIKSIDEMLEKPFVRKTVVPRATKLPLFLNPSDKSQKVEIEIISNYAATAQSFYKINKNPPNHFSNPHKEKVFVYGTSKSSDSDDETDSEDDFLSQFSQNVDSVAPEKIVTGFSLGDKYFHFSKEWDQAKEDLRKMPKGIQILGKFNARAIKASRENYLAGDVKYLKGVASSSSKMLRSLALELEKEDQVLIVSFKSTAIAMQKLAFLDFVGEGDELRLQLIFLPTFEERVKPPVKVRSKLDPETISTLENYVSALDLDEDFDDEKNDYRDNLFKGYDANMEKFAAIIDMFTDESKSLVPKADILSQQEFFNSVDFAALEKLIKGDMAILRKDQSPLKAELTNSYTKNYEESEKDSDQTESEGEISVEPPQKKQKIVANLEENKENVKNFESSIADSGMGSSLTPSLSISADKDNDFSDDDDELFMSQL